MDAAEKSSDPTHETFFRTTEMTMNLSYDKPFTTASIEIDFLRTFIVALFIAPPGMAGQIYIGGWFVHDEGVKLTKRSYQRINGFR